MTALWTNYVRLLKRKETAEAMAVFRIAVGLIVLYTLAMAVFTDSAVPIWVDRAAGGIHPRTDANWLVQALGGATQPVVGGLVAVGLVSAITLTIGVFSRTSALLCLQACIALFSLNGTAGGGHDRVIQNALWLLVLSGAGASLSVDAWRKTGAWRTATLIPSWPRWLVVVQLCWIYGATGLQKLGPSWFPWGKYLAVYYALLTPSWARYDLSAVAYIAPLTQIGTAVTWLWEVSFPLVGVWLWVRHTEPTGAGWRARLLRFDLRVPYACIGLTMHAVLFVLMELGPFSLITVSLYFALWHPDEWRRWFPGLGLVTKEGER